MEDGAKKILLKEAATVAAGFPLRVGADSLPAGNARLVQMRDVTGGAYIDWAKVPGVALPGKRPPGWLKDGDILFAARGSNNYALALKNPPERTVCSPHFFVLRISDKANIVPAFLAWQINQKPNQDYLRQSATGSHIPNIRRSVLERLEIYIPSVYKQNVIAQLWDTALAERQVLDALMRNRIQQLDAAALDILTARMR